MKKIEFFVPGEPKPQGSKNQFGQESCKLLPAWRSLVSLAAKQAMKGESPTLKPVTVSVSFYFSRPKSHFGTGSRKLEKRNDAP
jgi:crossover junction endodeoxyribonuclease RusA